MSELYAEASSARFIHKSPFRSSPDGLGGMLVGEDSLACKTAARLCQLLQVNQGPGPLGYLSCLRYSRFPKSLELVAWLYQQITANRHVSIHQPVHTLTSPEREGELLELELSRGREKEDGQEKSSQHSK